MTKQTLSTIGPGAPFTPNYSLPQTPLLLCQTNGVLSYRIEVTDDDPANASATWTIYEPDVGGTAYGNFTLPINFRVNAIRANVTSYTSGTLTVELPT